MKNTITKIFIAVIAIFMSSIVSLAQNAKRIDFAKDGCCLVWEERVPAGGSKSYVFNAKKGQKLTIGFIDDTGVGSMDLLKWSIEPNADPMEMIVEVTREYTLVVSNNSNKMTSFRITLNLEDVKNSSMPPKDGDQIPSDAERINFPKGSIEINLQKTSPANGAKRFVFYAKAGQEIGFTVTPKNRTTFDIEFEGNTVTQGELFTLIAPRTGDYMIQVLNPDDKNQPFTLDLGIADPPKDSTNTSNADSADNNGGERVKFAKDETSTYVTKTIPAEGMLDFVINAKKGQTMSFTVGYDFADSDVEAYLSEPNLQDISLTTGPKDQNEFVVKKTGDHRLTVKNMSRKKITITLYLDIY